MNDLFPWLILFLPLGAAAFITLLALDRPRLSAAVSVAAVVVSFVLTVAALCGPGGAEARELKQVWLNVGELKVDFGLRLDPLSLLMLLIVTGVGSAIHIYSVGYMHGDRGFARFFACMSLFTFSMLGIVLSNNFFQMFIFWELVGVSSYLLIGFWYEKASAADAAKKAFLANRLGDFGFLLGILMVWAATGTLNFSLAQGQFARDAHLFETSLTAVGLLIFCGAVGKSAQFPLHVWLPDAMEGPTPVSALIHAATMVAAGVYMLCRVFFVFNAPSLTVIAWVGGGTSLMAALIATQQNDIKRILAYSTLSQLGYMVMAVGVGAPTAGMFHLATHAFFKALLFLGAGSVIHALAQEQDIWKMGRLREKMPATFWTFLIGTLALCGLWPLSGFYSKDSILGAAYIGNKPLFVLGVVVAMLTTFYMFRLFFVVFLGPPKSEHCDHAHESPPVMVWPLIVLAVASVLGGFMGIPEFVGRQLGGAEASTSFIAAVFAPFEHSPAAALCGLLAIAVGFVAAQLLYKNATSDPLPDLVGPFAQAARNKFYFDELYEYLIAATQDTLARAADWCDRWVVGGVVRVAHGGTELFGRALRLAQTGNVQTYAFLFAAGVALAVYCVLFR